MNTRPIFLHLASALALLVGVSRAETVSITVNSNNGASYADSTGSLLSLGCVIRVGIFDTSTAGNIALLQTSNNFLDLDALFTPLAESGLNAGTILESGATGDQIIINDSFSTGQVFGQITGIDSSYCTSGSALYTWVFNNADPTAATEWGIFTASSGWNFPSALGSETLSTREITSVLRGISTGDATSTLSQFQLSPVPEPSGALLVGIIGLGVLLRRVRHRASPVRHT